jgi:recombinational DNA repair protein RecT
MQKEEAAGAWKTDYEAMAMAKAIKQLAKYLPLSDELQTMVQSDESILDPKMFASDRSGELVDIERPDYEDAILDPNERYAHLAEDTEEPAEPKGKAKQGTMV